MQQGDGTPDQEGDHHDSGDLHNAQRLAARLVDTLDVAAPEVDRDHGPEDGRKHIGGNMLAVVDQVGKFVEQAAEILAGADHADGPGEDVIEDQGGDGEA